MNSSPHERSDMRGIPDKGPLIGTMFVEIIDDA